MATYTEMVKMVRDWSNRDTEVLDSKNIKTFLEFAADNVYRDLRIAPLEYTYAYDTDLIVQGGNTLPIPSDTIEFIQLRKKDNNSLTDYVVYNNKSDIRSFYDEWQTKGVYNNYFFTREGNNLIMYPDHNKGDEFELFYYRRLPDLDARYVVDVENFDDDLVYREDDTETLISTVEAAEGTSVFRDDPGLRDQIIVDTETDTDVIDYIIDDSDVKNYSVVLSTQMYDSFISLTIDDVSLTKGEDFTLDTDNANTEVTINFDTDVNLLARDELVFKYHSGLMTGAYLGKLVPNWLRDQNEKLILFGALAEAFTYLDEPEQAAKYGQRFDQELQNLNGEEMKRKYEGGAITVHYRSNLI